jgi:hypothetical protein
VAHLIFLINLRTKLRRSHLEILRESLLKMIEIFIPDFVKFIQLKRESIFREPAMTARIWKPNVSYGKTPETLNPYTSQKSEQNVRVSLQHQPLVSSSFLTI